MSGGRRLPLARALGGGVIALLAVLVLAIWLIPPQLDWTRYRAKVEELASHALGRPVRVEGDLSLTLLPTPELTAQGVAIAASEEDGLSLDVKALRLQVRLSALLEGRIVPRNLVLHEPTLRVSWPLRSALRLRSADWLGAFDAQIERGRLLVGKLAFSDLDATLHGAKGGALSASGTGEASGIMWHMSARLGAPADDGTEMLELALDGQGRANGLGATFSGAIAADGTVDGRLVGRGPDLSLLVPAPPVPFRGEGQVRAAGGLAAADDLSLDIGGSPVRGSIALRVRPTERLDLALAAGRVDLDPWVAALRGPRTSVLAWTIPVGMDLSAEAAELAGGTLRRVRASLDLSPGEVRVDEAAALLPGEAALDLSGARRSATKRFDGRGAVAAPDLRATLRWLGAIRGSDMPPLPDGVLRSGTLTASIAVGQDRVALTDIQGTIDGSPLSGSMTLEPGERPRLDADLRTDGIVLDPWLPESASALARLPGLLTGSLKVAAPSARLGGTAVRDFALDASGEDGAFRLKGLRGTAAGLSMNLSGTVGADGRIADGTLALAGASATPLADLCPAALRGTPALWRGPVSLQATAAGPANALATRLSLDLGDARLEAQPVLDLPARSWSGPAILRHPGARRFLAATIGLNTAEWPGEGSLALAGQFSSKPGLLSADRFDLTAGAVRASGALAIGYAGRAPHLSGTVTAENLPLPYVALDDHDTLALDALRDWTAAVRLQAAHLFFGHTPDQDLLQQADGTISLEGGRLKVDPFAARFGTATIQGFASLDTTGDTPVLNGSLGVTGLVVDAPLTGWPIDVTAGHGALHVQFTGEGHSPAALLATASGGGSLTLEDGVLSGLDLGAAGAALGVPGASAGVGGGRDAQAGVLEALAGGSTPFRSLSAKATIANGIATIESAELQAPAGTITFSGTVDLPGAGPAASVDLAAVLRPGAGPDGPDRPTIGLRLAGPIGAPIRRPELAVLAQWLAEHPER